MGTRNNPGAFNCYAAALPDEEIFTVLARDPAMPATIEFWIAERARHGKVESREDLDRITQAVGIADAAREWREKNLDPTGDGVPSWKLPRKIVDDEDPIRSLPGERESDYNVGQIVAKIVTGLRQVAQNMIDRGSREVEVVNDEHGFDLEAYPQYADRINGFAKELADLGIVDDRVVCVPSNWEVSDTDDKTVETCNERFGNIGNFRGAPPVELRAPILIHEGQRYTGTASWREGKLVLDNVEPVTDQVLETDFQAFDQGSDGLEPTRGRMTDAMFLQWIHERLVNVHSENRLYDYMHRFRDIIGKVRDQEIVTTIQERLGGETRHLDLAPEAGKTPVPDQIDTAPQDLSHRPEVPGHRFSSFVKGQTFAYAKGLEVSPQHLPAALDAMAKDGWYLLAIFGQTDTEHVGFIFHRFPTEIVIPPRIVDTGDENTLLGTIERNRESIRRAIHGGEFGYSPHDDEFGNSDCGLGRQQEP